VAPSPTAAATLPLDDIMSRLAQSTERRASFVEDKRLAALNTPLRSTGQLAYRKPDHLEKITRAPRFESLVVDGSRLVVTDSSNDPPRVFDLSGHPEIGTLIDTILGAVSGNLALLREIYDVSGSGSAADWHILLRPRDPALARIVREVRLAGGAELQSIESVSPNGDTDTLTITPLS
jgi:hypothetical protein